MRFLYFFYLFSKNILRDEAAIFIWSFSKVISIKSLKMVFLARIVRHKLCMVYAFFDFFCSKIIFDQKFFPDCCDKFEPAVHCILVFFKFCHNDNRTAIKQSVEGNIHPYCGGNKLLGRSGLDCAWSFDFLSSYLNFQIFHLRI